MIRLAVRCRAELADRVLAELLELVPGGVEEERGPDWAEFAVYGPPGEVPALPDLEAAAADGLLEVSSTEVPDDWADRWRDFHEPVWVADRLLVRPSWETEGGGGPEGGGEPEVDVVIDPGQAFGTGAHATTRMCLELLLELADAGEAVGSLADIGTGSGVLAIAAAKLGWSPVTALDYEAAALEAAAANSAANGVELDLRLLDLREQGPPAASTLVANLTAPLLLGAAAALPEPPPGVVVCSGLLDGERERVVAAFAAAGMEQSAWRGQGGWVAISFRRR